jgi:hypothetical protein
MENGQGFYGAAMNQFSIEDYIRKELMQGIILKIAKWLIKYVDGYSIHKNPGKRKK